MLEKKNHDLTRKDADHDHLRGKFRGAAHSIRNLNYQNSRLIPIFFHNLAGYDVHLFIKQFSEDNEDTKLIRNTEEKYISFSKILKYNSGEVDNKGLPIINKIELRFIDSFKFLSSLLEKLSKNLEKDQLKNYPNIFQKNIWI